MAVGWRAHWHGSVPGAVPCSACGYVRPVDAVCAGCRVGRCCAPPGPWRVCSAGVPGCGPYAPCCPPQHAHEA